MQIAFTLRTLYLTEQVSLCVCVVVFLCILMQQLEAARRANVESSNYKYRFHRAALLACLVLAALAVDPFGFHGIYHANVTPWLLANVSAVLLAAVIFLHQLYIEVESKIHGQPHRWVSVFSWCLIFLVIVACNTIFAVAHVYQRWVYVCAFYVLMAVVVTCLLISYMWVMCKLNNVLSEAEDNYYPRGRSGSEDSSRSVRGSDWFWKAFFFFTFSILCIALFSTLSWNVLQDREATMAKVSLDSFEPLEHLLLYTEVVAIIVIIAYAWVPESDYRKQVSSEESMEVSKSWKTESRQRVRVADESRLSMTMNSKRGAASRLDGPDV